MLRIIRLEMLLFFPIQAIFYSFNMNVIGIVYNFTLSAELIWSVKSVSIKI